MLPCIRLSPTLLPPASGVCALSGLRKRGTSLSKVHHTVRNASLACRPLVPGCQRARVRGGEAIAMRRQNPINLLDRRVFCTGTAAAFLVPNVARGETATAVEFPHLSAQVAEFAAGFDLKSAPAAAVERTRVAFIDT